MITQTKVLFALMVFFLVASCKDEVNKKDNFVVTVDASTYKQLGNVTSYIILSDKTGAVLAKSEIKTGSKYDLTPETPYSDLTFTLTELTVSDIGGTRFVTGMTYADIAAENMVWKPQDQYSALSTFSTSFTYTGLPSNTNVTAGSNYNTNLVMQSNLSGPFTLVLSGGTSYVFASGQNLSTGNLTYRLYTNNGAGYSVTTSNAIDLSLVNQALPTKTFTYPTGSTSQFVTVKGIIKSGPGAGTYPLLFHNKAFVTDLGSVFEEYAFRLEFALGNNIYTNSTTNAMDFEPLAATITAKQKTTSSITYTTTGSYDYDQINFFTDNGNGQWSIFTPPSTTERTVALPKIPADITAKWSEANTELFKLNTFYATDIKSVTGYATFLSTRDARWFTTVDNKTMRILTSKL